MRVQAIPRTEFRFQQANATGLAEASIPLATRIDTSRIVSGAVGVRLHSKSWSATSSFTVKVYNVSYTGDEPSVVYRDTTAVATVTIAAGDVAPKLYTATLSNPIGDQIQVVLDWTHGATTDTQTFAISVELELRDS